MAKQKGIIKLEGTIGDITFFKSQDGYVAKEKSGPTADRIANDPAFQRTRENGQEFGRAGKAGKVLLSAKNPNKKEEAALREPQEILEEMKALDEETADILNSIMEMI